MTEIRPSIVASIIHAVGVTRSVRAWGTADGQFSDNRIIWRQTTPQMRARVEKPAGKCNRIRRQRPIYLRSPLLCLAIKAKLMSVRLCLWL